MYTANDLRRKKKIPYKESELSHCSRRFFTSQPVTKNLHVKNFFIVIVSLVPAATRD